MAAHVVARGKWKDVEIDPNLLNGEFMADFISLQELTDYDLLKDGDVSQRSVKKKKKAEQPKGKDSTSSIKSGIAKEELNRSKKKQICKTPVRSTDVNVGVKSLTVKERKKQKVLEKRKLGKQEKANKREKNITQAADNETICSEPQGETTAINTSQLETKKMKKKRKKNIDDSLDHVPDLKKSKQENTTKDMSAWGGLFVPAPVMSALGDAGFTSPTPIQALTLPAAIRDNLDIVGAAETGSGKTLAFGIPLLHHILEKQEQQLKQPSPDQDSDSNSDDKSDDSNSAETDKSVPPVSVAKHPLYALILTPTRELAIQVTRHLQNAARLTNIRVVSVVGGMAPQKQLRMLRRHPQIVVATPGRLWELIQEGEPHLSTVRHLRYLVIDEADRMVEKGHFEELSQLLELINQEPRCRRQNFVFSATLTMVHSEPRRLGFNKKKKTHKLTEKEKLESLISLIGMMKKPKVIDLTRKAGTAETLTEARINCSATERDVYLYWFLQTYPGRTLVFANSKDCVRRMVSVFSLLRCCPLPLHADMHQRQRLKNLDRFKGNPMGLLLATDVAARGLDIPNVEHVVHYQVPRTVENYVHRSGRTARASNEGISIILITPEDIQNYRKITKNLNKDEDIPVFPVDPQLLKAAKERVSLTCQIDIFEHRLQKEKREISWLEKAANEMDMILDKDNFPTDMGDELEQANNRRHLSALKARLGDLLAQPLNRQGYCSKYPTKSGGLEKSKLSDMASGAAVDCMKQETGKSSKFLSKGPSPGKKQKNKNRRTKMKRKK